MWDLGTALPATAVVAGGALELPPLARAVGGFCAVIGFLSRDGKSRVGADGSGARTAGVVCRTTGPSRFDTGVHYRSPVALWIIDKTPLRWTIPRYWQLRRQRRQAAAR